MSDWLVIEERIRLSVHQSPSDRKEKLSLIGGQGLDIAQSLTALVERIYPGE